VVLALAVLFLGVGFTRPLHRVASLPGAYQQTGAFSYSGTTNGPSAVYPSGVVTTGDPIYPSLVNTVTLRFDYRFASALPHHVSGTIEMRALVLSKTDTWQRLSTVAPVVAFTGDVASIDSALPLSGLYALIDSVSNQTGVAGANYSADVQPVVHITGSVGNRPIDQTFSPVIPVTVTQASITLDVTSAPAPPGATYVPTSAKTELASTLHPTQPGTIPHVVANQITFAKYKIPVSLLRTLGIILAILALMLAVLHDRLRRRQSRQSDEERTASRFHALIVPVGSLARPDGPPAISVPDFANLAGLARFLERPILYEAHDGNRTFAVDDDTIRYVTSAADRRQGRETPEVGDSTGNEPKIRWRASAASPPRRRTRGSLIARVAAVVLVLAVATTLTVSLTASTSVAPSNVGRSVQTRELAQLAPAGCSSLALSSLRIVSGTVSNSVSNSLILGSPNVDTITDTGNGNCLVGGGGKDDITAKATSVCIIGPSPPAKYHGCMTKTQ